MNILELFSGTESFSKVAEARGHKVFTIDNDSKFNPDLCKDILKLELKNIPFKPDVIWASPPCTEYSRAKRNGNRDIKGANKNVLKTLSIIKKLKPKFWIIENPQTGLLKDQSFMKNLSFTDVSYCKYGLPYKKQTRLWNNFKFKGKICKKDCNFMEGNKHICSVGNGRRKWHSKGKFLEQKDKYSIPKKLCLEIMKSIEKQIVKIKK